MDINRITIFVLCPATMIALSIAALGIPTGLISALGAVGYFFIIVFLDRRRMLPPRARRGPDAQ